MSPASDIVTMERVMRRHPGARFSYDHATPTLPYEYFTVGLPCRTAKFGQVFGSATSLDLAYNIARAKLDDVLDQREAA